MIEKNSNILFIMASSFTPRENLMIFTLKGGILVGMMQCNGA